MTARQHLELYGKALLDTADECVRGEIDLNHEACGKDYAGRLDCALRVHLSAGYMRHFLDEGFLPSQARILAERWIERYRTCFDWPHFCLRSAYHHGQKEAE